MSEDVLNDLDVDAFLAHSRGKGVPQNVAAERRQQNRIALFRTQFFVVAVPGNAANRLVQRSLMLQMAESIDEDEIGIF